MIPICECNADIANCEYMTSDYSKLVYPDLSYRINGVLFSVHNELGRFRNENQYADRVEEKFKNLGIIYEREKIIPESFVGEKSGRNKIDFIVENKIILEIKSKRITSKEEYYQVRRYLGAFNKRLGVLVNFRDKYLKPKRILNSSVND